MKSKSQKPAKPWPWKVRRLDSECTGISSGIIHSRESSAEPFFVVALNQSTISAASDLDSIKISMKMASKLLPELATSASSKASLGSGKSAKC
jgi:hypothetical protein